MKNLAEQVRHMHEIRTHYRLARIDSDLESELQYYLTHTIKSAVYFLDYNDYYEPAMFLGKIDWFACQNKSFSDAEKLAKKHGFTTESVLLEDVLGFELPCAIDALKITWGGEK